MDGGARRGRQHESQTHPSSATRFAMTDPINAGRMGANTGNDRYRASALAPVSAAPRASSSGSYSTYYQEPTSTFNTTGLPSASMGYGTEYGSDTRQQTSGFSNYSSAPVMYNVAQPPAAQPQVYDSPAFTSRQAPSGLQIMTPDVASTYFGAETTNSSSHGSVQQPGVYQQTAGLGFSNSMSGLNQMQQQPPVSADVSMTEDPDYGDSALEERWINYKRQMAAVFLDISNGALQPASETLKTVSTWLLTQVTDLGLTLDDASLHADRIQLWKNFNHAWLALGRAQKEAMQDGQRTTDLLSREVLKEMVDELIRLCDGIERHGLVDYGVGVWEERIVEVFTDCMLLFAADDDDDDHRSSSR